ncbi:hypothetical protein LXA43DRAFT_712939 [Ganoderma leucocontextum]|nr:hypothetical protein LXA43DRAFT_712939 [Ganoderma leucocontextum]
MNSLGKSRFSRATKSFHIWGEVPVRLFRNSLPNRPLCITGAPASFTPFLAPVPIDEILRSISFLQNSTQLGELVILDQSDRSRSEVCVRVIEHILQPGSLRALAVDTGDRLHHQTMHICQLLISHVSQNLMNVHIQFRIERHSNLSIFFTGTAVRSNAMKRHGTDFHYHDTGSHAQALGSCLTRCAQLACLRIAIDCPAFESVDLVDASLPVPFFSNLLSSLPVALRVFAVRLSPPSSDWWEFCSMMGLDMPVLDDLLPRPGGRFPHLHRFDLENPGPYHPGPARPSLWTSIRTRWYRFFRGFVTVTPVCSDLRSYTRTITCVRSILVSLVIVDIAHLL